jgi:hypothetical protein
VPPQWNGMQRSCAEIPKRPRLQPTKPVAQRAMMEKGTMPGITENVMGNITQGTMARGIT